MKIVVDRMPDKVENCTFFREVEDGTCACLFNPDMKNPHPPCKEDINKCPFFTPFEETFSSEVCNGNEYHIETWNGWEWT